MRTTDPNPRIVGHTCVYTIVDEHMRYVRVYIPFAASGADDVQHTIDYALDTRPARLPKETAGDG